MQPKIIASVVLFTDEMENFNLELEEITSSLWQNVVQRPKNSWHRAQTTVVQLMY